MKIPNLNCIETVDQPNCNAKGHHNTGTQKADRNAFHCSQSIDFTIYIFCRYLFISVNDIDCNYQRIELWNRHVKHRTFHLQRDESVSDNLHHAHTHMPTHTHSFYRLFQRFGHFSGSFGGWEALFDLGYVCVCTWESVLLIRYIVCISNIAL